MTRVRTLLSALLAVAALALGGCGDDETTTTGAEGTGGTTAPAADACARDQLALATPGQLTVGTDKPAFPPYFVDDEPSNGKGFESAVAYAIADELGFAKDEVKWVVVPFNSSYAPGPKDFDFDVNQISITPQRARRVDFSKPYYSAPQAVVLPPDSDLGRVSALADLRDATIGVQIGTTSLDAVQDTIQPTTDPKVFNDSNDVVTALKQGQVDAVVVDLPTAFFITAAQVEGAKIAGQFEAPGGDRWGALLEKGSELTPCVDEAIQRLRETGELGRLEERWMGQAAGAPELR